MSRRLLVTGGYRLRRLPTRLRTSRPGYDVVVTSRDVDRTAAFGWTDDVRALTMGT
ncbi:MAG: hypothetical protein QM662_13880 [Gordonia sp. (in: high G+C Gram-positive bacteria)]